MSNSQIAALVQNILMIMGSVAAATGKLSPTDAQTIIGFISTAIGFVWNHFAALSAQKAQTGL